MHSDATITQGTAESSIPAGFTVVLPRKLRTCGVGECSVPEPHPEDAHASAFQAVSADNHPIHTMSSTPRPTRAVVAPVGMDCKFLASPP